jgi:four helix bundle protein
MPIPAHYRKLVAWQRADALFIRLHLLALKGFPAHERFVLASQLRRAALSVPANIVEGTARIHGREQLQFLRIAWSSLLEAGYYIHVAERLGYISPASRQEIESDIRQVAAPLLGLIRRRQSRPE